MGDFEVFGIFYCYWMKLWLLDLLRYVLLYYFWNLKVLRVLLVRSMVSVFVFVVSRVVLFLIIVLCLFWCIVFIRVVRVSRLGRLGISRGGSRLGLGVGVVIIIIDGSVEEGLGFVGGEFDVVVVVWVRDVVVVVGNLGDGGVSVWVFGFDVVLLVGWGFGGVFGGVVVGLELFVVELMVYGDGEDVVGGVVYIEVGDGGVVVVVVWELGVGNDGYGFEDVWWGIKLVRWILGYGFVMEVRICIRMRVGSVVIYGIVVILVGSKEFVFVNVEVVFEYSNNLVGEGDIFVIVVGLIGV